MEITRHQLSSELIIELGYSEGLEIPSSFLILTGNIPTKILMQCRRKKPGEWFVNQTIEDGWNNEVMPEIKMANLLSKVVGSNFDKAVEKLLSPYQETDE